MKYYSKFFLLIALLCCDMVVSAQQTSVTVRLTPFSASDGTAVSAAANDVFISTNNRECSTVPIILQKLPNPTIFVEADDNDYTSFCTDDFKEIQLSFYTSNLKDYILTFPTQKGDTLWLLDTIDKKYIKMVQGESYKFSVEDDKLSSRENSQEKRQVEHKRFKIVSAPLTTGYGICFRNKTLSVSQYPATANNPILVKDENGDTVKRLPVTDFNTQNFDLSDLPSGHYTIEANGETLTIGVK